MPQTVNGYTVPAGSDAISTIDDTLATFAGQFPAQGFALRIRQVVTATRTTQFTTTSTGFVDVTGLSVTITPQASTSTILILLTLGSCGNTDAASMSLYNLYRNSTAIAQPTDGLDWCRASALLYANNAGTGFPVVSSFIDSPATTSATTYKLAMRVNGGTGVINRLALNTDWSGVSTITVMEVAA